MRCNCWRDHVTEEQRDVLLPFLAKTEKDRRHLLLREDSKACLSMARVMRGILDSKEARDEMASCGSSACSTGWLGTDEHGSCRELRAALCHHYGVPSELVAALIDVESRWNPRAVSSSGAMD